MALELMEMSIEFHSKSHYQSLQCLTYMQNQRNQLKNVTCILECINYILLMADR